MALMRLMMVPSLLENVSPLHFPSPDYSEAVKGLKAGDPRAAEALLLKLGVVRTPGSPLVEAVGPALTRVSSIQHRQAKARQLRYTRPELAPQRAREMVELEAELEALSECW